MTGTDPAPSRHCPSLFPVDPVAAPIRELIPHLEHPFFGLSTKPRKGMIRHKDCRGNWLELRQDIECGLPTIFDQDLVIYAASAIVAERNAGRDISRRFKFRTADLVRFSKRQVGGWQYMQVGRALHRLTATRLRTNIAGDRCGQTGIFGMIDRATAIRKRGPGSGHPATLLGCEIVLSDWVVEAILSNRLLTLHPDYFRLRRPFDRRIHQIARRHCGKRPLREIGLAQLCAKSGSTSPLRRFRQQFKDFCARWERNAGDPAIGPFLDHDPSYDAERDMAVFRRRV